MSKLKIEPIVKEITQDFATQYMIQLELQDIYNSLNKIKRRPIIIYMPQYLLESIDDMEDNTLKEEFDHGDI